MSTLSSSDDFSLDNTANAAAGKRNPNRLLPLARTSPNFSIVEQLFTKGWRHRKKDKPHVHAVFKILWPDSVLTPYLQYRERVHSKDPNEKLLFHGTNRACLLAESPDNVRLCDLRDCSLCSIVRGSFSVEKCGSKHSFKRFGHGIYTSACSSKADDYSGNTSPDARLRVLILSRVTLGKSYRRYRNAPDFEAPPAGYDSVSGEVGWDLNYEETVCYTNDALRPAYLVVYGDPPPEAPDIHATFKAFLTTVFKTPLAS